MTCGQYVTSEAATALHFKATAHMFTLPSDKTSCLVCYCKPQYVECGFTLRHLSVSQFSCSVMPDSPRPQEPQHARPPWPSLTPGVYSNPCPSSRWCHPALILCRALLLLSPIPPSIRVFSNESTLHMRWPKYWSFSFSISHSNEHPVIDPFKD